MEKFIGLPGDRVSALKVAPEPGTHITAPRKVRIELSYSLVSQPEAELTVMFGVPDGKAWDAGGGYHCVVPQGEGKLTVLCPLDPLPLAYYLNTKTVCLIVELGVKVWKYANEICYPLDPQGLDQLPESGTHPLPHPLPIEPRYQPIAQAQQDQIDVLKVMPEPGTRMTALQKLRVELGYSLVSQPEAELEVMFGVPDGKAWEAGGGNHCVVPRGQGKLTLLCPLDPVHLGYYLETKTVCLVTGLAGTVWKYFKDVYYPLVPEIRTRPPSLEM